MASVHIIGAGMAGLSAAVELTRSGHNVSLYEAAPQAGGRCRSYYDPKLDYEIDNGNHLLLSGNTSVASYLKTCLLYTSPSPRDGLLSRMPSSA